MGHARGSKTLQIQKLRAKDSNPLKAGTESYSSRKTERERERKREREKFYIKKRLLFFRDAIKTARLFSKNPRAETTYHRGVGGSMVFRGSFFSL